MSDSDFGPESVPPPAAKPRRDDVDWLRICAVYLLFVFHTAKAFDPAPFYHLRNDELSSGMTVLTGFIHLWHMPLFFLLAGWSAFASLRSRGTSGFVRERFWRLFVPLVFVCAAFGPPIKFVELQSGMDASAAGFSVRADLVPSFRSVLPFDLPTMPEFHETYLEFLPTYFTRLERFTWSHLWFVAYLFTFSLLYTPVFLWLRRRPIRTESPSALWVYAPLVPLVAIQVGLRPYWPGLQNLVDDWANFAYYSTYLVLGFLLACQPELERTLHREWRRALAIGLAATVFLLLGVLGIVTSEPAILAGTAITGWCFVVFFLGVANRRLARTATPSLAYLREAAFPVYLLHQPAIVLLGSMVVGLSLGLAAKFLLLLFGSVIATMLLYHFVVRRSALLRVLHGMKPMRRAEPAASAPPEPGARHATAGGSPAS